MIALCSVSSHMTNIAMAVLPVVKVVVTQDANRRRWHRVSHCQPMIIYRLRGLAPRAISIAMAVLSAVRVFVHEDANSRRAHLLFRWKLTYALCLHYSISGFSVLGNHMCGYCAVDVPVDSHVVKLIETTTLIGHSVHCLDSLFQLASCRHKLVE